MRVQTLSEVSSAMSSMLQLQTKFGSTPCVTERRLVQQDVCSYAPASPRTCSMACELYNRASEMVSTDAAKPMDDAAASFGTNTCSRSRSDHWRLNSSSLCFYRSASTAVYKSREHAVKVWVRVRDRVRVTVIDHPKGLVFRDRVRVRVHHEQFTQRRGAAWSVFDRNPYHVQGWVRQAAPQQRLEHGDRQRHKASRVLQQAPLLRWPEHGHHGWAARQLACTRKALRKTDHR